MPTNPGLSPMMDMLGLRKLFEKAESGDRQATQAVQAFQDSPELTSIFSKKAEPDDGGIATSLVESLKLGAANPNLGMSPGQPVRPTGGGGVEVSTPEKTPKRFLGMTGDTWKQIAMGAQRGIRGYLKGGGWGDIGDGGFTGKWQQDQIDQLKRRHQMWDTAYQASQGLPPEVLTDPQFAGLAQAKVALDKDMMDGKVDNEKNVSGFLTELARFKPELDTLSLQSKAKTQAAGEGMLQSERIRMGLEEDPTEYNFEGTPTSRSKYLELAAKRQALEDQIASRLAIAEENRKSREFTAGENSKNRAAQLALTGMLGQRKLDEADKARRIRQMLAQAKQAVAAQQGEFGGPAGAAGLLKLEGGLFQAADDLGIPLNRNAYAALTQEERAQALEHLLGLIASE